jgi:ABC-type sugar transport system ATPase subunit
MLPAPDETAPVPALEASSLSKVYPGAVALADFSFSLAPGEVRALLGKNGAGKSTFSEILSGTIQPTSGEIRVAGKAVELTSPTVARDCGIATVHQDLRLFADLSVRENVAMGRGARFGIVSRQRQAVEATRALDLLGVSLDLDTRVRRLSNRDQQIVAIARALVYRPTVLILDEPTSALHVREVDHLIELVRRLAGQGVATIYISHRLDEIPRVADSVTVLRDGKLAGTVPIAAASPTTIVEMMVGRSLARSEAPVSVARSSVALSVKDLVSAKLGGVSLSVREGEVVGLWGMPGSGRTELLRTIYGLDSYGSGSIEVNGKPVSGMTPRRAIDAGLGLSPDDRKRQGLVQMLSVGENLAMAAPGLVSSFGVISQRRRRQLAEEEVGRLSIKIPSLDAQVRTLSGGNQQKVVLGKWLAAGTRILLLDEPTQGIDVEAKTAIYALLRKLAGEGVSTLVAPTEMQELGLMCDRVLILRRGRIAGELSGATADAAKVMQIAMGG